MLWTIPNLLTLLRVGLIPVLVVMYYLPMSGLYVAGIFILAGLTDWLDGYLARTLAQTSKFGEFLDPVADKLMVAVVLVLLVSDEVLVSELFSSVLFTIVAAIVVGREIAVSALREWMAELGNRGTVAVGLVGKVKTISQFVAISLLLMGPEVDVFPVLVCGELLFYVAGGLTLWSMVMYLKAAWPNLRDH